MNMTEALLAVGNSTSMIHVSLAISSQGKSAGKSAGDRGEIALELEQKYIWDGREWAHNRTFCHVLISRNISSST